MGKLGTLLAMIAVSLAAVAPANGAAAAPPTAISPPCPAYPSPEGALDICSAQVPSWDGSPLDVDVTEPMPGTRTPHPLMVFLHGFGNDKHEWESLTDEADNADKWHWNSHWFAEHGYYVLTYTARGFKDEFTGNGYSPMTPNYTSDVPGTEATIHLKSVEYEVRDTQYLAALVASVFRDIDPNKIAVSGGSYGGGESWTQASYRVWEFPTSYGAPLKLQVAIPKYPWTDLAYSLAPNGHPTNGDIYQSSQVRTQPGPDPDFNLNPFGTPKASYVTGFFAEGLALKGDFETDANPGSKEVQQDGPVSIPAWFGRATTIADPYNVPDPLMRQIRRGLTVFRGAYYQPGWATQAASGDEVAVFSISGWTDNLFPPVESFRQFLYLKGLDPQWPVALAVADVGHPPAQNKPQTWHRLNVQAWQFLQANIDGSHQQTTTVYSEPLLCAGVDPNLLAADQLTATTPQGLSAGQLSVTYSGPGDHFNQFSGAGDRDGIATDPLLGYLQGTANTCRFSVAPTWPGRYSAVSDPLTQNVTYVGLGEISIPYTGWNGVDEVQLDARLWDVAPDGRAVLVTRGTYRMAPKPYDRDDTPGSGTVVLPLFGNEYALDPGHKLRIDVAEQDAPFLFPNQHTAGNITITTPTLTLPLREAVQLQMAGSQTSA